MTHGLSRVSNINWYRFEPTYFVFRDLNSGQPLVVQAAWVELARRDANGSLSTESRDKLVRFALIRQANALELYMVLDTDTINYLGRRLVAGDLPQAQRTKIGEQSVRMQAVIGPTVIAGEAVSYSVECKAFAPNDGGYWVQVSMNGAAIDGMPIQGNLGGSLRMAGIGSGGTMSDQPNNSIPGKHELSLNFRIEIYPGAIRSAAGTPSGNPLYQGDRTFTGSFEVVPKH